MPELVPMTVHPIEYTDGKGNRIDQQPYVYRPFPKMMYRKDGAQKIVNSEVEMKALGDQWADKPVLKPIWDTRQQAVGFQLGEHHLGFLKFHGFDFTDLEQAKAWFSGLKEDAQEQFLRDAEDWVPAARRGPGRPPKES